MPRFDPPDDLSLAALTATVVALDARVTALEGVVGQLTRVILPGLDGSLTITAIGQLKLSSVREIDLIVGGNLVKVDLGGVAISGATLQMSTLTVAVNAAVVSAQSTTIQCSTLTANQVINRGRPL
jgi:hypothetical protein